MSFNPDLNKETQEIIFLRKMKKSFHSENCFNNISVGIYLNKKLNIKEGIDFVRKL